VHISHRGKSRNGKGGPFALVTGTGAGDAIIVGSIILVHIGEDAHLRFEDVLEACRSVPFIPSLLHSQTNSS